MWVGVDGVSALLWWLGEGFGGFDEPAFGEEVVFVGFVGAAVEGLQGGLGVPGDEGEAVGLAGGEAGGGLHLFLFEGPLDGLPVGFGIEGAGDDFFDAVEGGVEGVGVGGGVGALVGGFDEEFGFDDDFAFGGDLEECCLRLPSPISL